MKADNDNPTVQYGVLTWGPCVLQIRISEEFQKKLLDEALKSRKESLSYIDKLAGVIKEEYSYEKKEMFQQCRKDKHIPIFRNDRLISYSLSITLTI